MPKSVEEMEAALLRGLEESTGRSIADWVALVHAAGIKKHGEIRKYLQDEHGLSYGYANTVAAKAREALAAPRPTGVSPVDEHYAGPKAALRPIYDALESAIDAFGNDVEFSPKKGYMSLRRGKQFGLIQPSTRTRIDVGLVLKNVPATARLEASGSFNAMMTHRVRLSDVDDVDEELIGWLRTAYEAA